MFPLVLSKRIPLFSCNYDYLSRRIDNTRESKMLKEDTKGANYVKDVTEIEVKSTEEALELMHRAMSKRSNGSNGLNEVSSRSHCIFTIRVAQASFDPSVDMFNAKVGFGYHPLKYQPFLNTINK